jgi:peroxiredoxin Q/BCP
MMPNRGEQVKRNEERMAAEGITALARGDTAPPFSTQASDGSELSIPADLADDRLLLFFYPADNTPNTTRDLQTLGKFEPQLAEANIKVYAISGGSMSSHEKYAERYGLTIPLLLDADLSIAEHYGCAPEDAEFVQRTLVGIDTDGKIAFFERGFPLFGKPDQILTWFAGEMAAPAAEEAPVAEDETAADGGKLAELDEEQRRAIYQEIKQERDRAWAEAEGQYPLEAEGTEQREQVRKQGELALQLEEQYLSDLAASHELTRDELLEVEAEGDSGDWSGGQIDAEDSAAQQ